MSLDFSMKSVFNLHKGDTFQAMSDIGWVVGHSQIVYGPLIVGASSIFFEGKPIVPNVGKTWDLIEKYKSKCLYIAPTGLRIIKKLDYDGEYIKKADLSCLESVSVVGERCDPDTIRWIHRHIPHVLINDTWWQTESGVPMCGNLLNIREFGPMYPTLPGSVTRPVPGYDIRIFDEENNEVGPGVLGKVVIKLPMPPSFMLTLWGNDEAFIAKYLAETPGYYTTGDAGNKDEHGYVHIMTRVDDVINTAGHRISTGRLEEAVNETPGIVESAVVGYNDELRGECPLAFIILKGANFRDRPEAELNEFRLAVNNKVRGDVGAFAKLFGVIIVNRLPKTKSGKILRGTMKKIVNKWEWKVPATVDDPTTLDEIISSFEEFKSTLKAE